MADTVQYLMEQMIPELEDLEQKGYFSRAEIKTIVQKRQNFEYLLKRRSALKEDFYRYIDFEEKLEELRVFRKRKHGIKGKKSLSETAIVRRIHFIYERAGRKFRSDLSLWMRWIEACKRYKSSKQLSKVITKALQRHSTVSALWIEAARWEFENNNDVSAARSLMQQGIRMCKRDETIWLQYYHLELLYALKLRVRRRVLGIDEPEAADGEAGAASAAAVRAVMQGGVARIVYKNAIATMPESLAFRARFLGVLRAFDYGFVEGLLDQIHDSIRQDFSQEADAWDILARRHVQFTVSSQADRSEAAEAEAAARQLDQHNDPTAEHPAAAWDAGAFEQACKAYEEALAAVPTTRMYQLFTAFLREVLEQLLEMGEVGLEAAVGVAAQLFAILQRAHSANCSSPETYITWAECAESVQQPKMALKAARKGCERFPSDVAMWRRRLQLELAARRDQPQAAQQLLPTFTAALQATRPDQAVEVWLMSVDTVPADGPEFSRLGDLLVEACVKNAKKMPSGGLGHVAAAMVKKARTCLGVDVARQLYGRFLLVPGPGGDLYRCAIALELEALRQQYPNGGVAGASSTSANTPKAAAKRIGDLFEAAVASYGSTETDLWIEYARWLMECGKGAGQVYWRATKELADPDDFVAKYSQALGQ